MGVESPQGMPCSPPVDQPASAGASGTPPTTEGMGWIAAGHPRQLRLVKRVVTECCFLLFFCYCFQFIFHILELQGRRFGGIVGDITPGKPQKLDKSGVCVYNRPCF